MNKLLQPVLETRPDGRVGTDGDARKVLTNLARYLRRLHQALVQVERRQYEKAWGPVDAGRLLQLLTRHPDFAWLHALSERMVEIDEMLDLEQVTAQEVRMARGMVETLLALNENGETDFSRRYFAALHNDPAIVIAHVDVMRALGG